MKKIKMISLLDYVEIIFNSRKLIIKNIISVTLLSIIISLLLPYKYKATATMLPPNTEQASLIGMISSNIPSEIGGLASLGGGILPGVATPSDLYAAIMRSSSVKGAIIKKYDLKKEFKAKTSYDASKALDEITAIEVTQEGIIAVSVTYTNKYLAADIANSYLEELDRFNTETAMTTGKKYRIFIEKRLKETADILSSAEEKLREFQENHRTIALDAEVEQAITMIAELESKIILLEVKKGALSSSSYANTPYLYSINRELRELKKQLQKIELGTDEKDSLGFGAGFSIPFSKLPELSLEYARLFRDVTVQGVIYELLIQQYEQAKIMELKDTPTVQILDKAGAPERRSFPKRSVIVIIAVICSFLISTLYVFMVNYIKSGSISNATITKLKYMVEVLYNDFNALKYFIKNKFKN